MRLGQLARKLALRPSEISDFLLLNNISIEEGSNAKLQDQHVVLIMQKYAPSLLEEMKRELVAEQENEGASPQADLEAQLPVAEKEEPLLASVIPEPAVPEIPAVLEESIEEKNEVIKAPKIALSGLKVIGKIDLPEPKKKEEQPVDSSEVPANATPVPPSRKIENRKEHTQKRERAYQQPRKNPIALQRERELEEIEQKKKAEAERKKEQRTRNYLNKVKSVPTKPLKLINEQVEESTDEAPKPAKTWLGKFFRWLRS